MADSLSTRARALVEAAAKATPGEWHLSIEHNGRGRVVHVRREQYPASSALVARFPNYDSLHDRHVIEATVAIHGRNDAPDIATAYLEAMALIHECERCICDTPWSTRGDNMLADLRAWLVRHEAEQEG